MPQEVRKLSLEQKVVLPKAISRIAILYRGDQLGMSLDGLESITKRNIFWEEAAEEFSPFKSTILSLRESLNAVWETREDYLQVATNLELAFGRIKDKTAQHFLGEILFSRFVQSPGQLDHAKLADKPDESETVLKELGFSNGSKTKGVDKLTLEQAIEAVLKGYLQFSY